MTAKPRAPQVPTPSADAPDEAVPSPAEAAQHLKASLGRAWEEARDTVRDVGETWKRGAGHVGAEARHAASQTRETLGDAWEGLGELGEGIADDSLQLARAVGVDLERYVRRHPLRSLAIAAATGAVLAHLLRGRR